ncbi:MAG: ATP phosphoribosyltransferase regulatory subunit, partial [Rhodobacteraceae bacterium]|nr:ATP phosphoribosyltransferase regulatory subunit [Paracoccaceae bacterium]
MAFVSANETVRVRLRELAADLANSSEDGSLTARHAALTSQREFMTFLPREQYETEFWNKSVLRELRTLVAGSATGAEGVEELETIADLLAAQGYGPDRIIIDPSVVRGLGYYTGPVFEAELTFQITDDDGRPRNFGSVAGGGRYDDLVKRFTG